MERNDYDQWLMAVVVDVPIFLINKKKKYYYLLIITDAKLWL